jgi:hypothetical protein
LFNDDYTRRLFKSIQGVRQLKISMILTKIIGRDQLLRILYSRGDYYWSRPIPKNTQCNDNGFPIVVSKIEYLREIIGCFGMNQIGIDFPLLDKAEYIEELVSHDYDEYRITLLANDMILYLGKVYRKNDYNSDEFREAVRLTGNVMLYGKANLFRVGWRKSDYIYKTMYKSTMGIQFWTFFINNCLTGKYDIPRMIESFRIKCADDERSGEKSKYDNQKKLVLKSLKLK